MTTLLDSNVLIALVVEDHVHHDAAECWLSSLDQHFATCPSTQGSLLRLLIRRGLAATDAVRTLEAIADDTRHEFWIDDMPYTDVRLDGVIGHRQVTDAYLAQLARQRSGTLATFDRGLAHSHVDVVHLVDTSA